MAAVVAFHYDVVCPYAYLASKRIEAVARRNGASIVWKPTLLGGIYALIDAPQGKDGSASDVMSAPRRVLSARDLRLQCRRHGVVLNWHPQHPLKSVDALRLLIATPDASRAALSHALFDAYWVRNEDVTSRAVLLQHARKLGLAVDESVFEGADAKDGLRANTQEAVDLGAPGVPAFVVNGRLFWGQDRLHFVDKALGSAKAAQPRALQRVVTGKRVLTFYYDFSSPWSYLGHTQVDRIAKEVGPGVVVEEVPMLLGAVFKEIGTPNVPMLAMSRQKSQYMSRDMADWMAWWQPEVELNWPSKFPIRSVLPLRVAVAEPRTRHCIYTAAWVANEDVADAAVLKTVLDRAGFDGAALMRAAESDAVKKQLTANTKRAVEAGVCGAPSFQVDGGEIIWGQDRLDVVQDLLCGWTADVDAAARL